MPIPTSTGFSSYTLNAGTIRNLGVELLLSVVPVQTRNFTWDVSANFTKNYNRVTELYGDTEQISLGGLSSAALLARRGQPYGVFQATSILRDPAGNVVVGPDGTPRTAPTNAYVGNIQPDFLAGLVNTVTFKGLRSAAVLDTRQGGKIYSRTRSLQRFAGTAPETLFNDREPFVLPNSVVEVAPGEFVPNTVAITNDNLYSYWGNLPEETNIIDASFVKLREVSLAYTLPKSLIGRTPFGNVELGVFGRNLLLWTPEENTYIDPETNSFGNGNLQGFEFSGSPSTRTVGANIRLSF